MRAKLLQGTGSVGAGDLLETAAAMGIAVARPNTPEQLRDALPQAAIGQGQVIATPFEMARVAATVANGGSMPQGRWVIDAGNERDDPPKPIVTPELAGSIGEAMRRVVTSGTAKSLRSVLPPIAGKTGTAEVADRPSHSWFIGYAPYGAGSGRTIAFSVIIEHGGYGSRQAARAAAEIVEQAAASGLIGQT
ncbi:MAG: hypothetical protein GY856_49035 [bacterium]|nr:hypothetical protein [bacterium]